MAKRIIHPSEFDAACRAYWELEHDAWSELPELMRRKVRARVAAALAAVGIVVSETTDAGATPPR